MPTPDTTTSKGTQPGGDCVISRDAYSSGDSVEGAHYSGNSANFKGGYTSSKGGYIIFKGAYTTLTESPLPGRCP